MMHAPAQIQTESARHPSKGAIQTGLLNLPFTDMGNAQRLVSRHGKDLRYCPAWKKWLVWDGKRWRVDDTGEVIRRAKDTMRELTRAAVEIEDADKRAVAVKRALASQSVYKIGAMVQLAQCEPGIPVRPNELDRDPYLLNCLNGTINLKTGKLRPQKREELITKLVPVNYDPKATCPQFGAFLTKVMGGDAQLVGYLQRAAGYSLTGDVGEKALFFLHGDGNNGKTTFLEALRAVMGDYAGQIPIESLMTKHGDGISNDIASLRGLRYVTCSEVEQGRKLAEAKVKQLTGMGMQQGRFLYGEFFQFDPTFKIFMDANHKPEIRGTDRAIWNRIKLVPFTVEIPAAEIDTQLPKKLRSELAGILAWAVRGCLEWQRFGLREPEAIAAATEGYREEMDTVEQFIDDECTQGPSYEVTSKVLYAAYKTWCSNHDEDPMSQKYFGDSLKQKGLYSQENQPSTGLARYCPGFSDGPQRQCVRWDTWDTCNSFFTFLVIEKEIEKLVKNTPLSVHPSHGGCNTMGGVDSSGKKARLRRYASSVGTFLKCVKTLCTSVIFSAPYGHAQGPPSGGASVRR
jgi:putative DNA primase/helicase